MEETRALRLLVQRDESALAWLIDRYTPYVAAIVERVLGGRMTRSDVEEVTSDVFFVLWNNAEQVGPGKIKAYLGGVARNKAKGRLRELHAELPLEEDVLTQAGAEPQTDIERSEEADAVRAAVLAMGQLDREIFLRHYFYYQTVAEIAGAMEMNLSTVKTRLRRGRDKLKETLWERGFLNGQEDIRLIGLHSG